MCKCDLCEGLCEILGVSLFFVWYIKGQVRHRDEALTADALDALSEMQVSPGLEAMTQAWLVPDGVVLKQNKPTLVLGIIALVQYRQKDD